MADEGRAGLSLLAPGPPGGHRGWALPQVCVAAYVVLSPLCAGPGVRGGGGLTTGPPAWLCHAAPEGLALCGRVLEE